MLAKLQKLLDGEIHKLERNGIVFSRDNNGVVQVSSTGLFTPPMSFTLNDTQLRLLRSFVSVYSTTDNHDIYLVKLQDGIRLAVENEFEQLMLDLYEDGTATAHVYWSQMDGDRWTVFPNGDVRYTGDIDGYRRMPEWVELALPVEV